MKSFIEKFSWTFLSNILYAASQFLILSIIAKVGGPKEVGIFTLSMAIVSPVFLLLNVKLRSVLLTDQKIDNTFIDYFNLRNWTNSISLLLIIIIALFLNLENYLLFSIILLALSKIFEMKSDIYYGLYQKKNRYDLVGVSTLFRGTLSAILAVCSYYIFQTVISVMLSLFISNFIIYLLFDKKKGGKLVLNSISTTERKSEKKNLYSLFFLALPLGVSTVIGSLNTNFPRYLIEAELGLYELGIFSALTYLLIIGNTFLAAISQVVTPKLASLAHNEKYKQFINLLLKIQAIGMFLSILFVFVFYYWGIEIITIIYTEEYAAYHNILMVIVIGIFFLYSSVFLGTAITSLRLFRIQPFINATGLVTTIVSGLIFIKSHGLLGMAFSILLNNIVISISYITCIVYILKKRSSKK